MTVTWSIVRVVGVCMLLSVVGGAPLESAAFGASTRVAYSRVPDESVESRITQLHKKLAIKPEQESLWQNVAQAMRDNDKAMTDLRQERLDNKNTRTAVEALNAYAQVVDMHAQSIRKFILTFQPLYDSMSEAQKKTADVFFRSRAQEGARRK